MKTFFIDANVLLRFILKDVPDLFSQSRKILEEAKSGKHHIYISQIIIFEVVFTLKKYYKWEKSEIIENIKALLALNFLEIESKEIFTKAIYIFQDTNISFVDSFLLARSRITGHQIKTFDRKLEKLQ